MSKKTLKTTHMDNFKSILISLIPTSPVFFNFLENPTTANIVKTIVLPVAFFLISKFIDVCVQFYFKKKYKK